MNHAMRGFVGIGVAVEARLGGGRGRRHILRMDARSPVVGRVEISRSVVAKDALEHWIDEQLVGLEVPVPDADRTGGRSQRVSLWLSSSAVSIRRRRARCNNSVPINAVCNPTSRIAPTICGRDRSQPLTCLKRMVLLEGNRDSLMFQRCSCRQSNRTTPAPPSRNGKSDGCSPARIWVTRRAACFP